MAAKQIGIVLFDGVEELDAVGPWEVSVTTAGPTLDRAAGGIAPSGPAGRRLPA
jgi:putative intracellular protease/amidase